MFSERVEEALVQLGSTALQRVAHLAYGRQARGVEAEASQGPVDYRREAAKEKITFALPRR
ncbi:hypothetical protein [Microbispora sp. H11081]|uniref:hypothetical protein n=1 Tax=Microbispora sp. H11081 TaxID=2729107 RepID=UPI001B8D6F9C|nr:hypothetical protein [Microbispora sp. H11081]